MTTFDGLSFLFWTQHDALAYSAMDGSEKHVDFALMVQERLSSPDRHAYLHVEIDMSRSDQATRDRLFAAIKAANIPMVRRIVLGAAGLVPGSVDAVLVQADPAALFDDEAGLDEPLFYSSN